MPRLPLLLCAGLVIGLSSGCGHLDLEAGGGPPRQSSVAPAPAPRSSRELPKLDDNAAEADYLRYAALNNAGLEAAFARWNAALEREDQTTALPDPRLSYTYYIEEVETRVGPQKQKIALSQTFPWFGKRRLQGEAASSMAQASRQDFEKAKLALFYRVKSAYHEYWYLSQAVATTQEHLKLATNLERVARTRFSAGLAPNSSVIQAQVELGKLEDRLRTLEAQRTPVVARLNAALNRPMELPLPWPRALPDFTASFTDEAALQALLENNPDLRRLDHRTATEAIGIQLARKSYYPDVTLGVEYVDTGAALNPDMADSGKDPVMAMISVNVPLWHDKYRAAEREARFRKQALAAERADTQNRLRSDLESALYQFRDAQRKIDLYGNTLVPKAEQSLKVTQEGFETGKESFTALIDTQRLLLEFQLAYQRALADRGQRLAEIEMLAGKTFDDDAHGQEPTP